MLPDFSRSYRIIHQSFAYNGNDYNIAITPELFYEDEGLDFTGNYHCMIIASHQGTKVFEMIPDEHSKWTTEPAGIDPGLIDKLAEIIAAYRRGDYHQG